MSEWNVRSILHALVRSWWLLAGVALIAGVIAYAAAGRGETAWVGDATLQIDNAIVSRIPALPIPERLLVELQSTEFKERVFSEAGVTDGQLSFYTTGNPQTELHVQYVGSSEELTRRVTDVAATSVVDRYIEMSEPGLARMRLDIAAANEMKEACEATVDDPSLTVSQRLDIKYRIYSLDAVVIANETQLQQQEAAYAYVTEPTVAKEDLSAQQRSSALAAGFVGLVFAAFAVVGRELLRARRHEG